MLVNPSMPVRQLSLLAANFAAHLESCTVRFKVHNPPLPPSEVPQPHFGCCISECFTPASSPGDLRLHVDTASLSLETGWKQVVQLASGEHVYLSAPRQDGTALRRGRRRGIALALLTVYRLLDYFTGLIFRYKKGNAGASIAPPHPIRRRIPLLQHLLHLFSILDAAISFHN